MKKFLILFLGFLSLSGCGQAQEKITDPHHPDFDINNFHWQDYDTVEELSEVLKAYFSLGTSRTYIENVLLNGGYTLNDQKEIDSEYVNKVAAGTPYLFLQAGSQKQVSKYKVSLITGTTNVNYSANRKYKKELGLGSVFPQLGPAFHISAYYENSKLKAINVGGYYIYEHTEYLYDDLKQGEMK